MQCHETRRCVGVSWTLAGCCAPGFTSLAYLPISALLICRRSCISQTGTLGGNTTSEEVSGPKCMLTVYCVLCTYINSRLAQTWPSP
jgi:hypothetical protein